MLQNSFNINEENTYKQYYYGSDDDIEVLSINGAKRKRNHTSTESLDDLFEIPQIKKKKLSSTVSRAHGEEGVVYLSTNADDGINSSHLIKIEIYDLKKLSKIPQQQHWKYADVRVKYYADSVNMNVVNTKKIIYNITKEISNTNNCKKYVFNNKSPID